MRQGHLVCRRFADGIKMNLDQWLQPVRKVCQASRDEALLRQNQLIKPPGSLGELETWAINFAGWQGQASPQLNNICLRVFAADHGVVAEGVSAFPQAVTAEMIRNFSHGGAAITVLAKQHAVDFKVINLGTAQPIEDLIHVDNLQLSNGSNNFCTQPALTDALLSECLTAGSHAVDPACQLFIGGEIGIGNSTAAAALTSALLCLSPDQTVGRGTGIDDSGLHRKLAAVRSALELHTKPGQSPMEYLRRLGGLEIAALAGAYIHAAQHGIPSLVDGFIASAAALAACKINPGARDWLLFAHCSAEYGHQQLLEALQAKPILDLKLRLGEGSGAALVIPLLKSALALHNGMATFAEASVSNSSVNNRES